MENGKHVLEVLLSLYLFVGMLLFSSCHLPTLCFLLGDLCGTAMKYDFFHYALS